MMWCFICPMHRYPRLPGERITVGSTAATAKPEVQGVSGEGSPITWPTKYRIPLYDEACPS